MSFPRPLNDAEKAIARRVLEIADASVLGTLSAQLEVAVASEPCPCGCPSISITVNPERAAPSPISGRPVAEADCDGAAIMVWVDDGWLSNLEIYATSNPQVPSQWPPLESLRTSSLADDS